ncbi:MAG: hypothetical protein EOP79_00365 [Variovorax sp.]|nr:MAG: hypothetical protein EOP79_00365 [Variovorax sp.]
MQTQLTRLCARSDGYSHPLVLDAGRALKHFGFRAERILALALAQRNRYHHVERTTDPGRALRLAERQSERWQGEAE